MSNFKFKSTDLAEYFESGSSTIVNHLDKFKGFPTFSTASLDYEKITDSFGYIYQGQDLKDLYSIKSKSVQYTSGSGIVEIPTWANAIKVRIDTKQGAQGAGRALNPDGQVGKFADGAQGASYVKQPDGEQGGPGEQGSTNTVAGCGPIGTQIRTKNGGAGGPGGPGGIGGRATTGGSGGIGGNGALGGNGGFGKTYYSKTISNLDDIRGTGSLNYAINDNKCQFTGANFQLNVNAGQDGNDAFGGNEGQDGNDANISQWGLNGGIGGRGGDGGQNCDAPGTGSQGCQGGWGCPGSPGVDGADGNDGTPGANGDDATPGNAGANGNVEDEDDFQNAPNETSNNENNTQNRIIVHYFLH